MGFDLDALPLNLHPDRHDGYRREVAAWLAWLADTPADRQTAEATARIAGARERCWWFQHHGTDLGAAVPAAPPVERALLQRHTGAFLGDLDALRYGYRGRTSGSTGEPVEVFMCPWAIAHYTAHMSSILTSLGIGLPPAHTLLYLSIATGAWSFREPAPADPRTTWVRLDLPRAADALDVLERLRPAVLSLSPSTLLALLQHLDDRPAHRPTVIISTAEALPTALRRAAEERLGCPVVDSWGVAEIGPIAVRCLGGGDRWHVPGGTVVLEQTDVGVAVTTLRNRAMPLARYLPGDLVEGLDHGVCERCGHTGASFDTLHGRGAATVLDPDGHPRSPLPWLRVLMDERWPIARFQLVQAGHGTVTVRLTPTPDHHLDLDAVAHALGDAHPAMAPPRVVLAPPLARGPKAPALWRE